MAGGAAEEVLLNREPIGTGSDDPKIAELLVDGDNEAALRREVRLLIAANYPTVLRIELSGSRRSGLGRSGLGALGRGRRGRAYAMAGAKAGGRSFIECPAPPVRRAAGAFSRYPGLLPRFNWGKRLNAARSVPLTYNRSICAAFSVSHRGG